MKKSGALNKLVERPKEAGSAKKSPSPLVRIVLTVALFSAFSGCYNSAADLRALVDSHIIVEGQVSNRVCRNHGAVYYAFSVDNREYRSRAPNGVLNCAVAKRGDKVVVYYSPANPKVHTILNPSVAYREAKGWYFPEWAWIFVCSIFALAAPVCAYYRDMKSERVLAESASRD